MEDGVRSCTVPPSKPSGLKAMSTISDGNSPPESRNGDSSMPVDHAERRPPELERGLPGPSDAWPSQSLEAQKVIEFMKEQFKQQEELLRRFLQPPEALPFGGRQISLDSGRRSLASRGSRPSTRKEVEPEPAPAPIPRVTIATSASQQARKMAEQASHFSSGTDSLHVEGEVSPPTQPQPASGFRLPWVHGNTFGCAMVLVILLNVIVVGVEVQLSASLGADEIPEALDVLNFFFVAFYVVELVLKWVSSGTWYHFRGPDYAWNLFDFAFVVLSLMEVVIDVVISSLETSSVNVNSIRVFRLLRLARVLRGIRVMRVLRFVGSLRQLLHSILNTLKSLFWTLLLLLLLFFAVGAALTQVTADHCRLEAMQASGNINAVPHCESPEFSQYWGNLFESMLTLFMAISNGISWVAVIAPLREVSPLAVFVFLSYVVFVYFAVLNVVTGVFCQSAMESAASDKEMAAMLHLCNQKKYVDTIRGIFKDMDGDESEIVTIDEFQDAIKTETLSAFLESIDISTTDAWSLFRIIDADKSGCIDVEEFVNGCLSLRGSAKAIQVAKMSLENSALRNAIADMRLEIGEIRKRICAAVTIRA